jgi:hypothetical protein
MRIYRRTGGLDEINIVSTYALLNLNVELTVRKTLQNTATKLQT